MTSSSTTPTIPIVLALLVASCVLACVRPTAAPAALSSAVRSVAIPTATSQPKNAEPQCSPPNSSRWRCWISLACSRAGGADSRVALARPFSTTLVAERLPVCDIKGSLQGGVLRRTAGGARRAGRLLNHLPTTREPLPGFVEILSRDYP